MAKQIPSIIPFIREMNPLKKANPLGSNHSKPSLLIVSSSLLYEKASRIFGTLLNREKFTTRQIDKILQNEV